MADIIIRGMEMPSSCYECPCVTTVDVDVGIAYGCVFLKAMMYDPSDRLDECPLVELPPHGRLIDADAFEKMMRSEHESGMKIAANLNKDFVRGVVRTCEWFFENLAINANTIIPASEKEANE